PHAPDGRFLRPGPSPRALIPAVREQAQDFLPFHAAHGPVLPPGPQSGATESPEQEEEQEGLGAFAPAAEMGPVVKGGNWAAAALQGTRLCREPAGDNKVSVCAPYKGWKIRS